VVDPASHTRSKRKILFWTINLNVCVIASFLWSRTSNKFIA
jgi:hypothetical protein